MAKHSLNKAGQQRGNKLSGAAGFDTYYKAVFGERWDSLKEALQTDPKYGIFRSETGKEYYLDSGSILAALSLPVAEALSVLDMCAAPGGKSLVLASRLNEQASLVCNERSADRRNRLNDVVHEFLTPDVVSRIKISSMDGSLICKKYPAYFDAVLLDAPCSSERHVLSSVHHLELWTEARIRNLSYTQWALLSSAFLSLKNGGFIVYATCSLSPLENDHVVEKLLKKYPNAVIYSSALHNIYNYSVPAQICTELPVPEKTQYGFHVLPDKTGAGPLYFSVIYKEHHVAGLTT